MDETMIERQYGQVETQHQKDEPIEQLFLEGFLPNFQIHRQIKTALLLQLIASEPINILLVGDPAKGKTTILKEITQLHEKARYYEGVEYLPPFSPSIFLKGTLADVQLLCFNKLDNVSPQDRPIITDLMNSGIAILASATPRFGRFDPYDLIANQIDLPHSLISRFDLIFPIKDLPNRENDERIASLILSPPKNNEKTALLIELLRKRFAPSRQTSIPQMTGAAIEKLKEYYLMMRHSEKDDYDIRNISITARQLEGLAKLSKAVARIRQSAFVSIEDAEKAIQLMDYCLNQIAKDCETGRIDIDRLRSRITATQYTTLSIVKEIIDVLEKESKDGSILIETIESIANEKNITGESVEEALEKLRRAGNIFEPKRGFVQRI